MTKTAARIAVALGALAALTLTPVAAHAAGPDGTDPIHIARPGYLTVNEAGVTDARFPMRWCEWLNSDTNWGNDCGGFRNVASYAFNDSNHGNVVRLYYNPNYGGAWACLGPADKWEDFVRDQVRFTWGPGLNGYWQWANDNVASHAFRSGCA